jgi:glycosyltransferase involved in cell wall biosynthesis
MKISFVVPARNEEGFIGKCLESILREQAGKNHSVEIIVVDNASADATRAVALRYPGVRVVEELEKGITKARQRGFLESNGDLVANVDADNVLPPGWIDTVMKEFSKRPDLVCFSGPLIYHDLSWWVQLVAQLFYGFWFPLYFLDKFVLRLGAPAQGGNFVCRRTALERVGGFNTKIDFYGEDTDIGYRLSAVGNVVFTLRLPMYSSGRRLAHEGVVTTGARYALNHFWVLLFKHPFTKTSTDVRSTNK